MIKKNLKKIKTKLPKKSRRPAVKKRSALKTFIAVLPQLMLIVACVGVYYAMVNYYYFFDWGIYVYYLLKLLVAFAILSGSLRSLSLPLAALVCGTLVLFTNNVYITTLMNADTAWELIAIALIGIFTAIFMKK